MLRERAKLLKRAHRALDICLTAAAFMGAYGIKKYLLPEPLGYPFPVKPVLSNFMFNHKPTRTMPKAIRLQCDRSAFVRDYKTSAGQAQKAAKK